MAAFYPKVSSGRDGTTQTIAYSTTTAATNAFGPETYQVCLVANSACHYAIGDGAQTATTANPFLPANTIKFVTVTPGQHIAALQAATGGLVTGTAGTLWVTELS